MVGRKIILSQPRCPYVTLFACMSGVRSPKIVFKGADGQWRAEQIPLVSRASVRRQKLALRLRLYAFGNHFQIQRMRLRRRHLARWRGIEERRRRTESVDILRKVRQLSKSVRAWRFWLQSCSTWAARGQLCKARMTEWVCRRQWAKWRAYVRIKHKVTKRPR